MGGIWGPAAADGGMSLGVGEDSDKLKPPMKGRDQSEVHGVPGGWWLPWASGFLVTLCGEPASLLSFPLVWEGREWSWGDREEEGEARGQIACVPSNEMAGLLARCGPHVLVVFGFLWLTLRLWGGGGAPGPPGGPAMTQPRTLPGRGCARLVSGPVGGSALLSV